MTTPLKDVTNQVTIGIQAISIAIESFLWVHTRTVVEVGFGIHIRIEVTCCFIVATDAERRHLAHVLVVFCCIRIVQAVALRGTTVDFQFIAYTVTVCVAQAVAVAIVGKFRVCTRTVIVARFRVVVARRGVSTTTVVSAEAQGQVSVLALISVREHLNVKLTGNFTRCGQLRNQHALVITGVTVARCNQSEP